MPPSPTESIYWNDDLCYNINMGKMNVIGHKYNRLTVIEEIQPHIDSKGFNRRYYRCRCDCGNEKSVSQGNLRSGEVKSCGCLHRDKVTIHNHSQRNNLTKTYFCWRNMKNRCLRPKNKDYYRYGGRGIMVCPEWLGKDGFVNFLRDMGEVPEGLTIDRIEVNGNYELSNCRWATREVQNRNKRKHEVNIIYG